MVGTVTSAVRRADSTELELVNADGRWRIRVDAVADHAAARRVHCSFRRCAALHVQRTEQGWVSTVHGVAHRRPVTLPVSLPTVLGLAEQGLHTVVRHP